jgi:hypothetical protein
LTAGGVVLAGAVVVGVLEVCVVVVFVLLPQPLSVAATNAATETNVPARMLRCIAAHLLSAVRASSFSLRG